jgi:hypothetical protein
MVYVKRIERNAQDDHNIIGLFFADQHRFKSVVIKHQSTIDSLIK